MKRASYREGVAWIALNDNAAEPDTAEEIACYLSVKLLADLFDVSDARIAEDVLKFRTKHGVS